MKKYNFERVFLFTFFICLFLFIPNVKASALEARQWIDNPAYNSEYNNKDVFVSGWALNPSGVKDITISLNDVVLGQATKDLGRPDVAAIYPGYPNGDLSGFSYTITYSLLRSGSNKISIEVAGIDGTKLKSDTYVITKKPIPLLCVDSPYNGQVIQSENVYVGGWALNASGIKKVNVVLNNTLLGEANIGISREDVAKVYPAYTNAATSGYNFAINNSSLVGGKNYIKIQAVGNDGAVKEQQLVVEKKVMQPYMIIDYPSYNQSFYNKNFSIGGWAVNYSGIKVVKIYVDDVYKADASIGSGRPDVGAIYPQYLQSDKSGFLYNFDVNTLTAGSHKITVEALGNDGSKQTQATYVSIKKPEAKGWIDSPYYNEVLYEDLDNITVSGWALNASGIKAIKVFLDGTYLGETTANILRSDVNQAYPGYTDGVNSGFKYLIPNANVTSGNHKIAVEVTGNDGSKYTTEQQFQKKVLPHILAVDAPGYNAVYNNSKISVYGWTLNRTGISAVNIYVDDNYMGSAQINGPRGDVGQVYPSYINSSNSGYNYEIDVDNLPAGLHKITIESVGNDGSKIYQNRTIELRKKAPVVNIDFPTTSYNIKTKSIDVTGWVLSDSNIQDIKVFVDGVVKGTAVINLPRPDVNAAYPGYKNGNNSGYVYTLDTSSLSMGTHVISVQTTAFDGSTATLQRNVLMFGVVEYVNYANTLDYYVDRQFTLGGNANWDGTPVTRDQIAYYMNPANFIDHDTAKYMFLKLTYTEGITVADLNKVLQGRGVLENKGSVFLEAGKRNNINPIYLVSHALLETGNGTSKLSTGILVQNIHQTFGDANSALVDVVDRVTYNMYGIGAYDSAANMWGSEKAYSEGWFTIDDAIIGGAAWIGKGYIASTTYKQYTLYKMKWNFDVLWHEYATDIGWAYKQTSRIKQLVDQMDNPILYFEVPVFKK